MQSWLVLAAASAPGLPLPSLPDATAVLHAVAEWGTPALGFLLLISAAGVPLPVEYAVVAVGALTGQPGGPNALGVLLVGTLAATAGDSIDYALGLLGAARLRGWMARRRRKSADGATDGGVGEEGEEGEVAPPRLPDGLLRHRGPGVMLTRFVFAPASTPMSLFAGASGYAFAAYLLWDATGEAIYVGGHLTLGRLFGRRLLEPGWQTVLLWLVVAVVSLSPVLLVRWLVVRRERAMRPA